MGLGVHLGPARLGGGGGVEAPPQILISPFKFSSISIAIAPYRGTGNPHAMTSLQPPPPQIFTLELRLIFQGSFCEPKRPRIHLQRAKYWRVHQEVGSPVCRTMCATVFPLAMLYTRRLLSQCPPVNTSLASCDTVNNFGVIFNFGAKGPASLFFVLCQEKKNISSTFQVHHFREISSK